MLNKFLEFLLRRNLLIPKTLRFIEPEMLSELSKGTLESEFYKSDNTSKKISFIVVDEHSKVFRFDN